jgi:hypothetical protein
MKISKKELRLVVDGMEKERVEKCGDLGCCYAYYIDPEELIKIVKKFIKEKKKKD